MAPDQTYKAQLEELNETYTGKDLEAALGISIRSVQNYLKKKDPTIPGRDTIDKIREVFAKHKKGESIKVGDKLNSDQSALDKLAEANLLNAKSMAEMVAMLKEDRKTLHEINSSLQKMPTDLIGLTAKILEGQEALARRIEAKLPPVKVGSKTS